MSSPAAIRRETKMRLWREEPNVSIDGDVIYWGRRQIPVSQLTREGRRMLGVYDERDYVKAELPKPRVRKEVEV